MICFLELTTACNLSCDFCYNKNFKKDVFPISIAEKLLNLLEEHNASLVLTGGEPLLHNQVLMILDMIKTHGMEYSLASNGACLVENIELLTHYPPSSISLSIDGSELVHDTKRNAPGLFKKIVHSIEIFQYTCPEIAFNIQMTVAHDNLHAIEEVVTRFLAYANISQIKVTPDCNHCEQEIYTHISNTARQYSAVKTEVVSQHELQHIAQKLHKGQFEPYVMVIKPNGYVHPYFGLGSEWDLINVSEIDNLTTIESFFQNFSLQASSLFVQQHKGLVDLNRMLYNFYVNYWKDEKILLSNDYIVRCDDKVYIYNTINKTLSSSQNPILAKLLDSCRISPQSIGEVCQNLHGEYAISKFKALQYIFIASKMKLIVHLR